MEVRVSIPPIKDLSAAVRIYYQCSEIGNKEFFEIFGKISTARVVKLKNLIREWLDENGIKTRTGSQYAVETKTAYKALGINIGEIERKYDKLIKFGFVQPMADKQ